MKINEYTIGFIIFFCVLLGGGRGGAGAGKSYFWINTLSLGKHVLFEGLS
jgi:hypothetical protein